MQGDGSRAARHRDLRHLLQALQRGCSLWPWQPLLLCGCAWGRVLRGPAQSPAARPAYSRIRASPRDEPSLPEFQRRSVRAWRAYSSSGDRAAASVRSRRVRRRGETVWAAAMRGRKTIPHRLIRRVAEAMAKEDANHTHVSYALTSYRAGASTEYWDGLAEAAIRALSRDRAKSRRRPNPSS
ncbi:hypothetical protein BOSEA31B_20082 [Hyphomicrobiales bacterium]|nr:hypothetical protein BOSEA31B_20082 [Hyphomicrobiales bacterium]CAH1702547.1 hypothetical protein BOSEA1005_30419 [Hyphomicrobiales bacterium]